MSSTHERRLLRPWQLPKASKIISDLTDRRRDAASSHGAVRMLHSNTQMPQCVPMVAERCENTCEVAPQERVERVLIDFFLELVSARISGRHVL
jgi:hypothetical protein